MVLVLLEIREGVAKVTLNRPERHNSLIPELLENFLEIIEPLHEDRDLRALCLGAKGRSFSTGGDLRGFIEHIEEIGAYAERLVGLLNRVILSIVALPVPTVCAVHGMVTGGSLGLALACDSILVAPAASFTPYYSQVGFSPDGGWTAMLPEVIGRRRTAEVLLTNRTIDAETAVRWGLADALIPDDRLSIEAENVGRQLAAADPASFKRIKALLGADVGALAARLETEREQFVAQITTPDTQQRMVGFWERMRGER